MSPYKYSIIITAMNEVESLRSTVRGVVDGISGDDFEILISTSSSATNQCLKTIYELKDSIPRLRIVRQERPYVAGAILDAVDFCNSEALIFMAADGETDPRFLSRIIKSYEERDLDMVATTRWTKGGDFGDYRDSKKLFNGLAQLMCKALYGNFISDWTYGFRLCRRSALLSCNFKELRHPWFLEQALIASRKKWRVDEVGVTWTKRVEGETFIRARDFIGYLRPIIRVRFSSIKKLST